MYSPTVLEARRLRPGVSGARSFWGCEREFAQPLPAPAGLLTLFDVPWLVEASPHLCLHLQMAFSLCTSVSKFPPFLMKPVIGLGPTLMILTTSAVTLFPNKATF